MRRGRDKQPRRPWTEADNEQLRALVAQKLSRRDVAAACGRSEGSVRIQCRKLGLRFDLAAAHARATAAVRAKWKDPQYRAAVTEQVRAAMTPERRARLAAMCSERRLWEHGQRALQNDPAAQERRRQAASRVGKARVARQMSWLMPHHRADYERLRCSFPAADVRRILTDEWKRQFSHAMRAIAEVAESIWQQPYQDAIHFERDGWTPQFQKMLADAAAGRVRLVDRRMAAA